MVIWSGVHQDYYIGGGLFIADDVVLDTFVGDGDHGCEFFVVAVVDLGVGGE